MHNALPARINELAADIGRLKRRHPDDHIVDRAACNIEAIIIMLGPTAAELVAWTAPGDRDAIVEAIRITDDRSRNLRHLLGLKAA